MMDKEKTQHDISASVASPCVTTCFTCISAGNKWIVDFGASKHIVSDLSSLTESHKLCESKKGVVHLHHARVSNIGCSQVLGRLTITDLLHIL